MSSVDVATQDSIRVITLNNPDSLNAWDTAMQEALFEAVVESSANPEIRGIVITGAGQRAFCAGQDLKESSQFGHSDIEPWLDRFSRIYYAIMGSPKPVVAALNGVAAGSGYQLALVCDIRVAHSGVTIGQPEVSSGIPSVTGLFLTRASLGHSRTIELMLSGRMMDASEANALGLIHQIVADVSVLEAARDYALRLAAQPATAFRLTKQRAFDMMQPGLDASFTAALRIDREAWDTQEPQETARQFIAERKAKNRSSEA